MRACDSKFAACMARFVCNVCSICRFCRSRWHKAVAVAALVVAAAVALAVALAGRLHLVVASAAAAAALGDHPCLFYVQQQFHQIVLCA